MPAQDGVGFVDAQHRCAHEDQHCLGAQGPYVAAGYHDDDYHYTLPCVGGPTDRQAAAQPRLRLTAAAGRAATLQPPSRLAPGPLGKPDLLGIAMSPSGEYIHRF